MNKIMSVENAISLIKCGDTVAFGGLSELDMLREFLKSLKKFT